MGKNKKKKRKGKLGSLIAMAVFMFIGGVCGWCMVSFADKYLSDMSDSAIILSLVGLLVAMYVIMYVQIAVHEAGHLVFGLMTGYEFCSYRLFSFMLQKEGDRLKLCRMSIAGTGGQCLMAPPELADGTMPVVLYNLGGCILNTVSAAIGLALYFIIDGFFGLVMLMFAIIGFAYALTNGLPLAIGGVDNDGRNAMSLGRDKEAIRAFWIQLKANEMQSRGYSLAQMPEEWFNLPEGADLNNSLVASTAVMACSRLMEQHRFEEADEAMQRLISGAKNLPGLYRSMLSCDRIYCELVGSRRDEVLEGFMSKEQKKFMKSMKTYPAIIRTEYLLARLWEDNGEKADKALARFEKVAKNFPYPGEIQTERGYMEYATK